jgi:heterotetrameric sarcosine oxidase gamma subunit
MQEWHARLGDRTIGHQPGQQGIRIVDLSLSAKLSLLGNGVADFAAARFPNSTVVTPRGATCSKEPPGILACRLSSDQLLLQADSADDEALRRWVGDVPSPMDLFPVNMTSALACIALEGRDLEPMLRRLTSFDVSERNFPVNSCGETSLAGVQVLLVRVPESIRLLVSWDLGEYLRERLWDAGQAYGMTARR